MPKVVCRKGTLGSRYSGEPLWLHWQCSSTPGCQSFRVLTHSWQKQWNASNLQIMLSLHNSKPINHLL